MPGVPVGVITKLEGTSSSLTKEALVRPFADDTALGVVGVVVVPPRTDPRFSVLPPSADPVPDVASRSTPSPGRHGASARRHRHAHARRYRIGGLSVRRAALAAALLLLAILIQLTVLNNLRLPGRGRTGPRAGRGGGAGPDRRPAGRHAGRFLRWSRPGRGAARHPPDRPVRAGVLPGRVRLRAGRQPPERVRLGADRRGGHRVGRRGAALRADRDDLRRPRRHLVRGRSRAARLRRSTTCCSARSCSTP